MSLNLNKIIKVILAALLFLCLADMPYGYYQSVRFAGLIGFGVLSLQAYENKRKEMTIVYLGLAVLFQPFIKIALGRQIWNVVDVIVGLFLIGTIFFERQKK